MRRYLATSLVLILFSAASDLTLRLTSPEVRDKLRRFSDQVRESIEALRPFRLAGTFYQRLMQSEYGWRPFALGAPFNVTAAKERFRGEHPECAHLGQGLWLGPEPLRLDPNNSLLGERTRLGSGSATAALLSETPAPTPGKLSLLQPTPGSGFRSRLVDLLTTPTPGPFRLGLGEPGAWPTPAPTTSALFLEGLGRAPQTPGIAERMLRDAEAPVAPTDSGLGRWISAATCTDELRSEFEAIEGSSLQGISPLLMRLVGLPDALLHTALQSLEGGPASVIPAVVALLLGLGLLMAMGVKHPLALALLAPLAGSVAAWLLLLPVWLLNKLFGWALAAVELLTVLATVPPVLWLLQVGLRVAETVAVDKAIEVKDDAKA
jgi:hypothetical protein